METKCTSTPKECREACVSADGLKTVWPAIAARRKKILEERAALPTRCTFCGYSTLVEDWKGSGANNMHCFDCKRLHPITKKISLKSRRFAMVIDNQLHVRKYEDPAHGWLAVPFQWLEQLGIVNQVSCCSYRRGATAYLEEDCDAPLFRKTAESNGFRLFVDYRHTNERSSIRSYPSFW